MLGLIFGAIAGPLLGVWIVYIKPIGELFLTAIKMLVLPLIFVSLVAGISSIGNMNKMGRIGIKTVVMYLLTTALAIPIGLLIAVLIEPGANMGLILSSAVSSEPESAGASFLDLIPVNPFTAFATGNTLQVIVFSILLGIAATAAGEKAKPFIEVIHSLSAIVNKLIEIVIALAPYGVFALVAVVTAQYGLDVILPLVKLIFGVYIGCLVHAFVVFGGLIKFACNLSVSQFFRGIFEAQLVAFSTTSAAGTLPVTMRCSHHNHGVSKDVAGFVLPVGATVNMDGTALYQALCAVFIAQAYGLSLEPEQYALIFTTTILASIGTAAVPAGGLVVLSMVLTTVGLPLEGVALIAGIDRILDMARSTVNVTGDAVIALVVAKSEQSLDQGVYYAKAE